MSNEPAGPARQTGAPDGTAASDTDATAASDTDATAASDTDATAASDTAPLAARRAAASRSAEGVRRTGGRRYRASQASGRRYKAGRPAVGRARPAQERPGEVITAFPSLASSPTALARMFALCLASCLLAAWLNIDLIAGLGFCAGCAVATRYSRPQAQLQVVLSVPAIFLAAEVITKVVIPGGGSAHRTVLSVFEGTVLTLAAVAPWLFAGTAVAVAIALFRGLPQCVRDLRGQARADHGRPRSTPDAAARRG